MAKRKRAITRKPPPRRDAPRPSLPASNVPPAPHRAESPGKDLARQAPRVMRLSYEAPQPSWQSTLGLLCLGFFTVMFLGGLIAYLGTAAFGIEPTYQPIVGAEVAALVFALGRWLT